MGLSCGVSVKDITPSEPIIHGLVGLMGCKYSGVHDALHTRVIALKNDQTKAAIIQVELDKDQGAPELIPVISRQYQVPEENILYFGIHTHAAPMFTTRRELQNASEEEIRCTKQYEEQVKQAVLAACEEAFSHMSPAQIGYGTSQCYCHANRVEDFPVYNQQGELKETLCAQGADFSHEISHEMFVMEITDLQEHPMAFLINYPVHMVTMFLNGLGENGKNLISSDVAGGISQVLESRFPDSVAIWCSGAAGDINPVPATTATYVDIHTGKLTRSRIGNPEEILNYLISTHCRSIFAAMNTIQEYSDDAEIFGRVDWCLSPQKKTVTDPVTHQSEITEEIEPEGLKVRLQALQLGDILFLGIGGELFDSTASVLKAQQFAKHTVVINHCGSLFHEIGYLVDDYAIERNYSMMPGKKSHNVKGITPAIVKCYQEMLGVSTA